ncbi:MAG: SGNH/GDSL hydrolase family protein [Chitinispirillaceae bacterium]|nr:SGNH/GDSL hydrolase family protein [Chitinispirillaceae bacterium]
MKILLKMKIFCYSVWVVFLYSFLSLVFSQKIITTPNSLISKNKSVKTSSGDASYLVDGKYGGQMWNVANNSWVAVDIGKGPSKVFIVWNNPAYTWSDKIADPNRADCKQTLSYPIDYKIECSENSTNGKDGDWITAISITDNKVSVRGHNVLFENKRWIKINITRGGGQFDEIEVFNTSLDSIDTWFFAGTSISANAYKGSNINETFSVLINQKFPEFYPAIIRGGIPCITTEHFARDISMYIEAAGNCHFWLIEMGTNDAWGGSNANVQSFKKNLQIVIDSCKKHNIEPIIAMPIATNESSAKWQVHQDFIKAVKDLTLANNLIEGADLYTAFKNKSEFFNSDGVHPNSKGGAEMYKVWAEKMSSIYQKVSVKKRNNIFVSNKINNYSGIYIYQHKEIKFFSKEPSISTLFSLKGEVYSSLKSGRYVIIKELP